MNKLVLEYDKYNEFILGFKANIYWQDKNYEEAKKIYRNLISQGSKNILVFNDLLKILLKENSSQEEIIKVSKKGYEIEKNFLNTSILMEYYVNLGEFNESYQIFIEYLSFKNNQVPTQIIEIYLMKLIYLKQYHKTKEFLELPKHNLKEKFKAIWYVLMYFMQDEYPNEYKKMGSELKQSVEDMIKSIKK